MSISRIIVGSAAYREKRRDKRNLAPTLVISLDGYTYLTIDWSLGAVLLSRYCGQRVQGEEVEGKVRVATVPGSHPFKAVVVRLSITHNFRSDDGAQRDVSEARHTSPHDHITGWRITGASEITAEPGDFGQILG